MNFLRKYDSQAIISFGLRFYFTDELFDVAIVAGDIEIDKDGAGWVVPDNPVTTETQDTLFELTLTATEMQAKRITIKIVDQTSPKAFKDEKLYIATYGNASAQIIGDLDLTGIALTAEITSAHVTTDALIASEHVTTDGQIVSSHATTDALINLIADLGSGAISVNHDTGGTDNLRYLTSGGAGIDNATVRAYLTSDYDASRRTSGFVKGITTTTTEGYWSGTMRLDAGDYTFEFSKQGYYGPDTKTATIS